MTTPEEAAIELHVRRLVDGYGLDEAAAREAVAAYRAGDMSAPTHFAAHRAACEVLADLQQQSVEVLMTALHRAAQQWLDTVLPSLAAALRSMSAAAQRGRDAYELAPPRDAVPGVVPVVGYREVSEPARRPVARDRPAWQTPYGPPARRSPRKR